MTDPTHPAAGDATAAFVSWLVAGAVGPALVALPVNLVADKLTGVAVRWFKRLRKTDDLSRLVKAAASTSVDLNNDEFKSLRMLLQDEHTWTLLGRGKLSEKLQELTGQIADCLPPRDGRTAEDARGAAGVIARGLLEFAVFDLQPDIFQKVVLARLQQMSDQTSALDQALFAIHKDLYAFAGEAKDLFRQVRDLLPSGPADLNDIKIYLTTLIDWLNTDPWPQDPRLSGPVLTPAAIERKLRISTTGPAREQDADADELTRHCSRLVILGGPGSGKTWLAMRIARICAEEALTSLADDMALDEVELPLYTTCSRLVSAPGEIREAAVSSALNWIGDLGGSRIIKALSLFFTERDTPTVLVIDSLDEASDASTARDRLRQAGSLKPPWRVVLTSRPSSWNNQLTIEEGNQAHRVGELQPLRYPDDVEAVIQQWFADQPERRIALAAQIAARPSLQQTATVPLILAFYCILGGDQALPEFRRDLYKQVINRMLHAPWRSGSGPPPDMDTCRATLRAWAWRGAQNHPVSGIGQWEDDIATGQAQLSAAGQDAVDHIAALRGGADFDTNETLRRFVHRSIREHLVAEHVAELPASEAVESLLPHLWYDPDWEYTAPAAITMHSEHDKVLRALLCGATRSSELPDDLSVIDASGEVRALLIGIAAESREDEWPYELASIIGRARVDLAASGDAADVAQAVHWSDSNYQVRKVVLRRLTRYADGDYAVPMAYALAQLDPTPDEKRQARAALQEKLVRDNNSLWAVPLAGVLMQLGPAPDDERLAHQRWNAYAETTP